MSGQVVVDVDRVWPYTGQPAVWVRVDGDAAVLIHERLRDLAPAIAELVAAHLDRPAAKPEPCAPDPWGPELEGMGLL